MTRRLRVAVVGVGRWGRLHASKYAALDGVELVGVVDIKRERAEEVASRLGTRPFYNHLELIGEVDAVSVATPTVTHYSIAKDFLEAGVDVLLEKPMAASLHEATELEELATSRGLVLQIGHLERFNGALQGLNGFLLTPSRVQCWRLSPYTGRSTDVDVVLDLMIHDLDLLFHLLGMEIEHVEAEGERLKGPSADVVRARIRTKGGWWAELVSSRVSQQKVRKMVLHQPEGELSLDLLEHRFALKRGQEVSAGGAPRDALLEEIRSFLDSVRNRRPPAVSGLDGRRALEAALRISDLVESRCLQGAS